MCGRAGLLFVSNSLDGTFTLHVPHLHPKQEKTSRKTTRTQCPGRFVLHFVYGFSSRTHEWAASALSWIRTAPPEVQFLRPTSPSRPVHRSPGLFRKVGSFQVLDHPNRNGQSLLPCGVGIADGLLLCCDVSGSKPVVVIALDDTIRRHEIDALTGPVGDLSVIRKQSLDVELQRELTVPVSRQCPAYHADFFEDTCQHSRRLLPAQERGRIEGCRRGALYCPDVVSFQYIDAAGVGKRIVDGRNGTGSGQRLVGLYGYSGKLLPVDGLCKLEFPGVYFNYPGDSSRWPLLSLGFKDQGLLKFNLDIFRYSINN